MTNEFKGNRALVLGLAREGVSLTRYLTERGALVTVTDSSSAESLSPRLRAIQGLPVSVTVGGDYPDLLDQVDELWVSPGVPEWNAVYQSARERNMPIRSMTTLFFDLCPAPIVGVTGSSGKTTTTSLIGAMLDDAGMDVVVGGNIGEPMLDLLSRIRKSTIVVLELSSFQLSLLRKSPHIALVTNITPNHLDRHGSMDEYVDAKSHILRHQGAEDVAVLNAEDAYTPALAAITPAQQRRFALHAGEGIDAGATNGYLCAGREGDWVPVIACNEVPLLGQHNIENVLASIAVASVLDVPVPAMKSSIQRFRPASHRLQVIGTRDGVTYIDDSIATSPARASVALRAISEPIVLIAGGRDKQLPWAEFAALVVERARAVLLIGEAAPTIERALLDALDGTHGLLRGEDVYRCESLERAVERARSIARPRDVVLLSPACTSYDMFANFEERGRAFAAALEGLDAA